MTRLSTKPYRGTRDFLPEEMSVRIAVFQRLYDVIERYGYVRYDGPLLESMDIYRAKSGAELVDQQIFQLTDRGGRELALRPEMTPTVARMIAANAKSLAWPVRWYSHVNCFRYERPQRGRLREHWQINVDVFGSESILAEVEIFELVHDLMAAVGAAREHYRLRVSDRRLVEKAACTWAGVPEEHLKAAFQILDAWEKHGEEQSSAALGELGLTDTSIDRIRQMRTADLGFYREIVDAETFASSAVAQIVADQMVEGVHFDPGVFRAFEYYTSTVFEVFDTDPVNRRSLFGGGRYSNLVSLFSPEKIPGIGFGMGDVTLFDFLDTYGLTPKPSTTPDVTVLYVNEEACDEARRIARALRAEGLRTVMSIDERRVKHSLRAASRTGVPVAVIVGPSELERGMVVVRDVERATQQEVALPQVAARVQSLLRGERPPHEER